MGTVLGLTMMIVYDFHANAGVLFENKPKLKVYTTEAPTVVYKNARAVKTEGLVKASPSNNNTADKLKGSTYSAPSTITPQVIALPGAVVGITVLAFVASKIDSDFALYMDRFSIRSSDVYGAGYETTLKNGGSASNLQTKRSSQKLK